MATEATPRKSLRIGVMLESVQHSDIIGIDIFGNLSREYFEASSTDPAFDPFNWRQFEPDVLDIQMFYMAQTLEPGQTTPGFKFLPNTTYDDCPRDLDIVLTGGPSLRHRPEAATRFVREAWTKTPVWMTTCTGALWLADAVDLKGKKVTTNRGLLTTASKLHPGANWLDQRWVVDSKPYDGEGNGALWTSGGAGSGLDMIATYCLQNFREDFVKSMALYPLEFQLNRSQNQAYEYKMEEVYKVRN